MASQVIGDTHQGILTDADTERTGNFGSGFHPAMVRTHVPATKGAMLNLSDV